MFKEDWSFLDKISMGAIGTRKVIDLLNHYGHRVIELERYSTSNKIWQTKIKRLRVPDLLCLNCGRRIESRAKSTLGIIMSDSPANQQRRWDGGLRNEDLVAFIFCYKDEITNNWVAADILNLFSIGDLRACVDNTVLGPPKSPSEGAERDRKWKSYVPGFNGTITSIEANGLKFSKDTGQSYTYRMRQNLYLYVSQGENITNNTKIVASIVPRTAQLRCDNREYDFLRDLNSTVSETKYSAVKALGSLNHLREISVPALRQLTQFEEIDDRIKLEALASLAGLGEAVWDEIEQYSSSYRTLEIRMETVFILGELINNQQAQEILLRLAENNENPSELRAASVWLLGNNSNLFNNIIRYIADNDKLVATHAISALEHVVSSDDTLLLINALCEEQGINASISRIISKCSLNDRLITEHFINMDDQDKKQWLMYAIIMSGRERFESCLDELGDEETKSIVNFFWSMQEQNWIDSSIEDKIDFIKLQK
ncbi:MAG: HEAT repeat domain-containing protein [Bacillota bacterium]